jgi:RNA recognition motif-containing protein
MLAALLPARRNSAHSQIAQFRSIRVKNIFVGNLNSSTSEGALRQLFAAFGPVDRVKIMMDSYTGDRIPPHLVMLYDNFSAYPADGKDVCLLLG